MVEIIDKAFCVICTKLRKYDEKGNCVICGEKIFEKSILPKSYIGLSKEDEKTAQGDLDEMKYDNY